MILNNAWSLLFRWLAQQQGSAHFPHLAMAYPKCVHSQCVGDVALVTEQQTNTNTVMPPQAGSWLPVCFHPIDHLLLSMLCKPLTAP